MKEKCCLYLSLLFLSQFCMAQDGPAGVLDHNANCFWYSAETLSDILDDGDNVNVWSNLGANGLSAYEYGGRRPEYTNDDDFLLNGIGGVLFDGDEDQLKINNNSDINSYSSSNPINVITYTLVFTAPEDVSERQVIYEEGGDTRGVNIFIEEEELFVGSYNLANDGLGAPWDYQYIAVEVEAEESYIVTLVFKGNDQKTGSLDFYLNSEHIGSQNSIGLLYPHTSAIALGAMRGDSYFFDEEEYGSGFHFAGLLYEFIHYNQALNEAQRIILENHLAAKYGLWLDDNDYYTMDNWTEGNYDFSVAGIGMDEEGTSNSSARGSGIVTIENPSDLEEEEYFIWGANSADLEWTDDDVPESMEFMLERSWRGNEIGGDVGTIDVSFDLSEVSTDMGYEFRIIVDTNNDNDFSDEEHLDIAPILNADASLTFENVDLGGTTRFTLAYAFFLLPVEFSKFNAIAKGNEVQLTWSTSSEINNEFFTVQRSKDNVNWENIQFLEGAGNSELELHYELWDKEPFSGINYYRIKQQDFNGRSDYSETKAVQIEPQNFDIVLYPNPTNSILFLSGVADGWYTVNIIDSSGRLYMKDSIEITNESELDLSLLPKGTYQLLIISESSNYSKPFIKE